MKFIIINLASFFGLFHGWEDTTPSQQPMSAWLAAEPQCNSNPLTAHQGEEAKLAAPILYQPLNLSKSLWFFCGELYIICLQRLWGEQWGSGADLSGRLMGLGAQFLLLLFCCAGAGLPFQEHLLKEDKNSSSSLKSFQGTDGFIWEAFCGSPFLISSSIHTLLSPSSNGAWTEVCIKKACQNWVASVRRPAVSQHTKECLWFIQVNAWLHFAVMWLSWLCHW